MKSKKPRFPIVPYRKDLPEKDRNLGNNPTKSERILWKELRGKYRGKYDFTRQKPIDVFIADFYCRDLKLVIELDRATHFNAAVQRKDKVKTKRLVELGLTVLRFWDDKVYLELDRVMAEIDTYIDEFEKNMSLK